VHPNLVELEGGFLIVWDDYRSGPTRIYAVRLNADGGISAEQALTPETDHSEYPALAVGESRLGLVHTVLDPGGLGLSYGRFTTFDFALQNQSQVVDLGGDRITEPNVTAVDDTFIVSWHTADPFPGPSIMAASFGEDGALRIGSTPITSGALHARTHSLVSLGDRAVMVWADDLDGNYELYSQVMDADLNVLRPRERITFDPADTISPGAVVTSDGGIGILFDDWRSGAHQVYYTRLDCSGP